MRSDDLAAVDEELANWVRKYELSGPRYTSYPTVPVWTDTFSDADYQAALQQFSASPEPLSIYVHIPFCHSRCYYCGCNVIIKRHNTAASDAYLTLLETEVQLVTQHLPKKPQVSQFHIGGGTPNYLTLMQIRRLFDCFHRQFDFLPHAEVSVEIDPRYLTRDALSLLVELGVNRISMGIQDFDPTVQKSVNRIQSVEQVDEVMNWSRELKIRSVNMDLIYGLPNQTDATIKKTIDTVIQLKPDRIAFYSYAHLPSQIKHQTILDRYPIPTGEEKLKLFLKGRSKLLGAGYEAIAMDHFALPSDELSVAFHNRKLYRNFMGYTTQPAFQYLGFGVSSIGYIGHSFIQNEKELSRYSLAVTQGQLPIAKGIALTQDDLIRQWVLIQIMCHFKVDKGVFYTRFKVEFDVYFDAELLRLKPMQTDGFVRNAQGELEVTENGKWFVRNIAMIFDQYLKPGPSNTFSKTV